jgi:hypothetical protein
MAQKSTLPANKYHAHYLRGFKAGIYEQPNASGVQASAILAMAMGSDPGTDPTDTRAEQAAYAAGRRFGLLCKEAYAAGFFPDLETALRGGSIIGTAASSAASTAAQVASDPFGELADAIGLSF